MGRSASRMIRLARRAFPCVTTRRPSSSTDASRFHPLFGGAIDDPSYIAFQDTPLQKFWPVVASVIGLIEFRTAVPRFAEYKFDGEGMWKMKPDSEIGLVGDLKWDPLGLKPTDPAAPLNMQNKELNNGRLAMLGIAGMVAQELVDGQKIAPFVFSNGVEI